MGDWQPAQIALAIGFIATFFSALGVIATIVLTRRDNIDALRKQIEADVGKRLADEQASYRESLRSEIAALQARLTAREVRVDELERQITDLRNTSQMQVLAAYRTEMQLRQLIRQLLRGDVIDPNAIPPESWPSASVVTPARPDGFGSTARQDGFGSTASGRSPAPADKAIPPPATAGDSATSDRRRG